MTLFSIDMSPRWGGSFFFCTDEARIHAALQRSAMSIERDFESRFIGEERNVQS